MSPDDLAVHFAETRDHLIQVARRILGSVDEAEDAAQEAWLRAERSDHADVENLAGWLTTVTARICLDRLRGRRRRGERALASTGDAGDPLTDPQPDPADDAVLVESVGTAMLVVLDRLSPAQRVAFVLHDLFAVPFEDIAPVVDRSVVATKKLASRARAQVRGAGDERTPSRPEHVAVVEAFLDAARGGDLDRLLTLLAPDVIRRADAAAVPPGMALEVRGATAVAGESKLFREQARAAAVLLVDGRPGIVVAPGGRLAFVLRVTVAEGRVAAYDVIGDPDALAAVDLRLVDPA